MVCAKPNVARSILNRAANRAVGKPFVELQPLSQTEVGNRREPTAMLLGINKDLSGRENPHILAAILEHVVLVSWRCAQIEQPVVMPQNLRRLSVNRSQSCIVIDNKNAVFRLTDGRNLSHRKRRIVSVHRERGLLASLNIAIINAMSHDIAPQIFFFINMNLEGISLYVERIEQFAELRKPFSLWIEEAVKIGIGNQKATVCQFLNRNKFVVEHHSFSNSNGAE